LGYLVHCTGEAPGDNEGYLMGRHSRKIVRCGIEVAGKAGRLSVYLRAAILLPQMTSRDLALVGEDYSLARAFRQSATS
jgi:hypothetical protein